MDFITIPTIIGIITFGIYRLFELFVHKKERLNIIEKLGDKLGSLNPDSNLSIPALESASKFSTLKIACLLLGVGFGLMIGYFICLSSVQGFNTGNYWHNNLYQTVSVIYGASVLLFGGLGLLVAFLVEMNYSKKKSEK
ncbi:hypothetical protein A9P82_00280 [Arachidicoccus ginsenosidimutans]|nr:hypothetical protein A9P82_00280 [Arachidicoccus sp. BS20]